MRIVSPPGRGITRSRILIMMTALVAVNAVAWLLLVGAAQTYLNLLAIGFTAYTFGLRHAVDADHISAIDNTTRKLLQEGKRPIATGLFFSLGHSTVVCLLCAALAVSSGYVAAHLDHWKVIGGHIGTLVSGSFLVLIGLINLVVLIDLFRKLRAIRRSDSDSETGGVPGGLLGRILVPVLRLVTQSWQMYLVGFLFGLGFDTASEVGILAIAARTGQTGLPFWVIMLLPLLFTAGMCLIDTLNGVLMLGAYGWAYVRPRRKIYYNVCITGVSVLVAFLVGINELLGEAGLDLTPKGPVWSYLDDHLGFVIIGVFLAGWAISALLTRARSYQAVET